MTKKTYSLKNALPDMEIPGKKTTQNRQRPITVFGKLRLILWKNVILKRRHWILSFLELAIPVVLMCLATFIRNVPDSDIIPTIISENVIFPIETERDLRRTLCYKSLGFWDKISETCRYNIDQLPGERMLFWGPPTSFTKEMVSIIQGEINFDDDHLQNVTSIQEMNEFVDAAYFQTSDSLTGFYIGIFFNNEDELPNKLNYDLRLQNYWHTDYVYPFLQYPGPRNDTDIEFDANYESDGFVLLQTIIDRAYIEIVTESRNITNYTKIEVQRYPYPPYVQDHGLSQLYGYLLPSFVVYSLVLLSPTLIKSIVHEKETGVREFVKMMGLESFLNWFGWFMYSFMSVFLTILVITIMVKVEIPAKESPGNDLPGLLPYSNAFLVWMILFLYGVASILFCFVVSCFFNRPSLATTIGVLAWLMSYFIPRAIMDYQYETLSLGIKLTSCLLPNMAMNWAFKIIGMFEGKALGIQWDNITEPGSPRDELTIALIMLMLVIDILLYSIITWYVDQVLPGLYGVPKPWYFIFQGSKCCNQTIDGHYRGSMFDNTHNRSYFEDDPQGLQPGIVILGLRKEFKTLSGKIKVAVNHVSFTCFKGQCTVLLGHNGAGKTTTMSMLTGVYAPSGGYAEINGWNIATHLKEARAEIGLCPQHNTLFSDLSVEEHLVYFARLKGLTIDGSRQEAETLLHKLQLKDKSSQFGNMLSGGMKRKLCLAIALIGGSQIIILDEPSSGLDPESRRWVWDIIQQERSERTVLVTTHHMEEAEVLADRAAIMSSGKVVACGSTFFLKNTFGDGYNLTVSTSRGADADEILKVICDHLPDSNMKAIQGQEYIYRLPYRTEKFADLLEQLTKTKETLRINQMGLSLTTMEQVFLRVGEIISLEYLKDEATPLSESSMPELSGDVESLELTETAIRDKDKCVTDTQNPEIDYVKLDGGALILQRLKCLINKKFIYSRRKWGLLLTQGLMPVLVTLLCLAVDASFNEEALSEPALELNFNMFEYTYSSLQTDGLLDEIVLNYNSQFQSPYEVSPTNDTTSTLLTASNLDLTVYRENYITSAYFRGSYDDLTTRMMYQTIPFHTAGIGINLIDNALLQTYTNSKNFSIKTNNLPLPLSKEWQIGLDQTTYSSTLYSMMMPIALAFLTASFLVFPLGERTSGAKQIQVMTGTSTFTIWFTAYGWDLLTYSISAILIFICCMAFDSKEHFTVDGAPGALALLLFAYGIGSIPLAYVFSFPFHTAASGFSVLALFNILSGIIISSVTLALRYVGTDDTIKAADILGNITAFVPAYPASKAFKNIVDMGYYNTQCEIIEESVEAYLCASIAEYNISSIYQICCPSICELYNNCFVPLDYLQWRYPGIGMHVFYLFLDGIFYFLILFCIEHGVVEGIQKLWWRLRFKCGKVKDYNLLEENSDPDVEAEKLMAEKLMIDYTSDSAAIVVEHLVKIFMKADFAAVRGISFYVPKGQCFGLLGVNGAGKTTTFKMLTGEEVPSSGDAKIGPNYLSKNLRQFLRSIGYCPQFDALIGELTGEEMLTLMAELRGVPKKHVKTALHRLIHLVDIVECVKRPCSTYSGGNKRKLSTAMALIGRPTLVFLDEPTSGVDPASRRKVWEAVKDANANGQSVILTSHSMDECEALCQKIVIMAKGTFKCAGTPQHLKFKYGRGYTLQIKVKSYIHPDLLSEITGVETEEKYNYLANNLKHAIKQIFPGSSLSDSHRGMFAFTIPSESSWPYIFNAMESLKHGRLPDSNSSFSLNMSPQYLSLLIEDYSVMDPSLEQVFLSFARESQAEDKQNATPKL